MSTYPPLVFTYRNYRGEVSTRRVLREISIRYGATEWHPEAQWLMRAYDLDKQAEREFAVSDILHLGEAAPDPRDALIASLVEALHPEILEAIADEIYCFEHSARAGSLRYVAKLQRAAIARATEVKS